MTAIIIVVVVALVFFVSICVVTFMVWKHETEMRTDSLKAIERKLEQLSANPGDGQPKDLRNEISQMVQEQETKHLFSNRGADPFAWMRSEKPEVREEETIYVEPEQEEVKQPEEDLTEFLAQFETDLSDISYAVETPEASEPEPETYQPETAFDNALAELAEMKEQHEMTEIELPDLEEEVKAHPVTYDTGRSGKKYTAEELEALIKE